MRHLYFHPLICSLFFLLALCLPDTGQGGPQFITYNGTLSGSFAEVTQTPRLNAVNCSIWNFDGLENSFLKLGINRNWYNDALWFGLERPGAPLESAQSCGSETQNSSDCGYHLVYNIDLTTSDYPFVLFGTALQFPVEMIHTSENVPGYNYTDSGYHIAFHQNSTIKVDNQSTPEYAINSHCVDYEYYDDLGQRYGIPRRRSHKKETTLTPSSGSDESHLDYRFTYTNTTVDAKIQMTGANGTLTLSFSGNRTDDLDQLDTVQTMPYNFGEYTPIAVDTSDSIRPNWKFANGSELSFNKTADDNWYAVAKSSDAPSFRTNLAVLSIWASITAMGYILLF